MRHFDLREHMKEITNLEGNVNYRLLRDAIADCVIKQVCNEKDSFFAAIKKWKIHPEEFKAKPEFPHFLGRNSIAPCYSLTKTECQRAGSVASERVAPGYLE